MTRRHNRMLVLAAALALASGAATAGEASKGKQTGAMDFDTLDADGDGRISKSEAAEGIPGIEEHWSAVDSDGDGYLDQSEFAKMKVGGGSKQ